MGKRKTIAFILVLSSLLLLCFYFLPSYFSKKIYSVVEDRVYRSGQLSGNTLEKFIKDKGIKTIVNLRGDSKDAQWYISESELAKKYNVQLYDIRLSPHDLPKYKKLVNILDIIHTSGKPILIHCNKGVDRTGMVSALALAVEQDPPLSELKKQFSLRYGVFPFYRSIGPYIFSMYEQWLYKTQKIHNKNNLLYWIRHEYFDSFGNLEFWIDRINDKDWSAFKNMNAKIPGDVRNIQIKGWAFDANTNLPVNDLSVIVDNQISFKANFIHNRNDVAHFFHLGDKYNQNFFVGWEVNFKRDELPAGCHKISLKFSKNGSVWNIPTENTFCL